MNRLIDWFLVWWLHTGRYWWSKIHRRLFERKYLDVSLPQVSSLEEIENSLKQVEWTMDGPLHLYDCISYPQVTWAKKKDDCDGFASLAAELLRCWNPGYNPVLITVILKPVRESHTVCAFEATESSLSFFDNDTLRHGDYQTYEQIAAAVGQRAQAMVCWDIRNPFTLEMIEFHRV